MSDSQRRIEDLLWRREEGEISLRDREWLEAELAERPEYRRLADEVERLSGLLGAVPPVEPPSELGPAIRQRLATARPPRRRSTWRHRLGLHGRPGWRPIYAAAAALLLVVAGILIARGPSPESREVTGAMGGAEEAPAPELALDERHGRLDLSAHRGDLLVEVDWRGSGGAVLTLSGAGVRARRLPDRETDAGQALAPAATSFTLDGPGRYRFAATPRSAETVVEIRLISDGELVARRTIRPAELAAEE